MSVILPNVILIKGYGAIFDSAIVAFANIVVNATYDLCWLSLS